jgi:flagellar FliJ protein
MTTSTSLDMAVELVTRLRDRGLRQLMLAEQSMQAGEQQLLQLQGYAQDTDQRWSLRTKAPTGQPLLHHHHRFVDRLQVALDLQGKVILEQGGQVKAARAELQSAEQRLQGLVRYRERLQLRAKAALLRAEQKQWDELALLKLGRTMQSSMKTNSP